MLYLVAAPTALDLAEAGVPVSELVTFGEPRVGNPDFAAYYEDSAVYPHFRVTHGRDPEYLAREGKKLFEDLSFGGEAFNRSTFVKLFGAGAWRRTVGPARQ